MRGQNRIVTKNIIKYVDDEEPRNDYPKRIVSPTQSSAVVAKTTTARS